MVREPTPSVLILQFMMIVNYLQLDTKHSSILSLHVEPLVHIPFIPVVIV